MNNITVSAKKARRWVYSENWYGDMCRYAHRANRRRVKQELREIAKDYHPDDDVDIIHVKRSEMVTGWEVF